MANPVIVEIVRNGVVDSFHRAAWALADPDGNVLWSGGDIDRPVFLRSCSKIFQTIPVIETGAADRFGFTDAELAVMTSSHSGEPVHQEAVRSILRKIWLDESYLRCGPHPPFHAPTRHELYRKGEKPAPIHNNCSGKHAGMLALAVHIGADLEGYTGAGHPVQKVVKRAFARMACIDEDFPVGFDGCDVPAFIVPLRHAARAAARFADPSSIEDPSLAKAVRRLSRALLAEPYMLAGEGRFCTALARAGEGRVIGKNGAEASYIAAVLRDGTGLAMKVDDGAWRASYAFLARVFYEMGLLGGPHFPEMEPFLHPKTFNHVGREVGFTRVPDSVLQSLPRPGGTP